MTFYGYRRPDGRVGVRNKVLILPTSVCASDTARIISQQVEGSVTFNNQQGCSQVAVDQQLTMDVMAGYAANPNIYGTVLVSLGCENCQMDLVAQAISERTCKPMQRVIIQEAGGTLNRNFAQREADLPDARVAKHITYTAYLDDTDAIISFCKLKSHGMLALSAATKNLFGAIPGTIKPEYHYRYPDPMDFAGMLIDLNEYFRPRLYLVDAVVAMEGNGPTAGTPRPFGALLAGTNPHRIDLLCASLIGLKPENVPTLRAAAERGLTPLDPAQLCVAGDAAAFACPDFRIVQHGTGTDFGARGGTFGRLLGKTAALALRTRPGLKRALCVGCGVCRDVCPAHAITIENGRAHIDRGRCIHCFCCQEFCPKGAMQGHRTVIARIAGHL